MLDQEAERWLLAEDGPDAETDHGLLGAEPADHRLATAEEEQRRSSGTALVTDDPGTQLRGDNRFQMLESIGSPALHGR
jgi:hypothetical protein